MPSFADRVRESSTTTGTGTLTLAGAPAGYQTFSAAFGSAASVYYTIAVSSDWEVGIGTTGTGTLSRDTVLSSSNGGSLVNFSAGTKDVFCSYSAGRAVTTSDAATLTNKTISGASNTLSSIGNASLTNSAVTVNGVSIALGASDTVADATKLPLAGGTLTGVLTGATNVGNIVPFYFADQTAFPSATTYHGAIAHSHADGKMYQAHGGAWVALANESGNVATATALQTARNINGVSFNGTADVTVTAAASTLSGTTLAAGVTASSLTSVGTLATLTTSGTTSLATTAGALSVYGVAYGFPASQGAASTVLTNNGSGTLTWTAPTAGAAAAGTLTGATLASNVLASSLTSVGTTLSVNGVVVGRGGSAVVSNTLIGANSFNANTSGSHGTVVGYYALVQNTTGYNHVAVGSNAMRGNTTGYENTGVGVETLYSTTTGSGNTAVGKSAGYGDGTQSNTTGNNNTFIGNNAMGTSPTVSDVITLGNSAIATLRCQQTSITSLSDARDKTDIAPIPAGLAFVNALKPVSFVWNMRDGGKVGIPEFGFIAQDLQQVQADHVTVPNLVFDDNPEKLEASAGTLIPVLVKAIQELTAQNTALAARIAALETI